MDDTTALREPETAWDYALSAADVLTLWRAREVPAVGRDPLRTDVVVLIGSALYARARSAMVVKEDRSVTVEEAAAVAGASLAYLHSVLSDTTWDVRLPASTGNGP
ncbi:hypothetical protein HEP81_08216 (plasmid) [Streptomyces griseofuscus]|uniref:Uncharacterized protein n=1 Tax=Streptomyces griseofuscus TaxID=146922 RepID=A0A7H1QDR2_9ACTN|nr:hypothetical protein [Streptomyces griseofuscus]QNT98442.1 hypothetical protein HEP81_08216 [Streptomyces griseofuscus]